MSPDEVAIIVADAAALVAADRGSPDVSLEASIAFHAKIRDTATTSNDWKTALSAQAAIDKLTGLVGPKGRSATPPPPPAPMARRPDPPPQELQASAILGVVMGELVGHPAARAAVLAKLKAVRDSQPGTLDAG
jgi:hypothetical protein